MRIMKILSVFILSILLFIPGFQAYAAASDGKPDAPSIKKLADSLYLKYNQDTGSIDGLVMKTGASDFETVLKNAVSNLAAYCTTQAVEKFTDKIRKKYKNGEIELDYTASDLLLGDRLIKLTDSKAVVRQYRRITSVSDSAKAEVVAKNYVKYVLLEKEKDWRLKDIVTLGGFTTSNDEVLLDSLYEDVTGDSQKDTIYLFAKKEQPEDIFAQSLRVVVNNISYRLDPGFYVGYSPDIGLYDFNGDKVKDVFISMGSGGSSGAGFYNAFSLAGNRYAQLVGSEFVSPGVVPLVMKFLDNYKVNISNDQHKIDKTLDISGNRSTYEEGGMFTGGKLADPNNKPVMDPYVLLKPFDVDGDGQYELFGVQYAWGFWHADTLFEFRTVLKYTMKGWELVDWQAINLTGGSDENGKLVK